MSKTVTISLSALRILRRAAQSFLDDLDSGVEEEIYEDTEDNDILSKEIQAALDETEILESQEPMGIASEHADTFKSEEIWFRNFYDCPACGHHWEDVYSAQPDDDCPSCGKRHISPYKSEDVNE